MDDRYSLKMKNRSIGEIITIKNHSPALINLDSIYLPDDISYLKNYVIHLKSEGTCFVYHTFKQPIFISNLNAYALCLLLTAGHCVCDVLTLEHYFVREYCDLNKNDSSYQAMYIANFMEAFPQELISSNSFSYCLPGDVAILALISADINAKFNFYPKAEEIDCSINNSCSVSGFPSYSDSTFTFMYPHMITDMETTRNQVKAAFYNFNQLVCSEGTFIESNYLLEVTSSTYVGMSGSPIVSNNKLIGIFCGGPPMPGQREVLLIAAFLLKDNPIEAYNGLKSCIPYDIYYTEPIFQNLLDNFSVCLLISLMCKNKGILNAPELAFFDEFIKKKIHDSELGAKIVKLKSAIILSLFSLIRSTVLLIKDRRCLSFNIGISTKHPAFQAIDKVIENSEKLKDKPYCSFSFREHLLNGIFK